MSTSRQDIKGTEMRNKKGQYTKGNNGLLGFKHSEKTKKILSLQRLGKSLAKKHGMCYSRLYYIWGNILNRCMNKKNPCFKNYGGRNIKVYEAWLKFENFRDDMYEGYLKHVSEFGEKQTTIERIDNNGNYDPSNCKWATIKEQSNNRRTNRLITYKGKILTLMQWGEKTGLGRNSIYRRLNLNWSIEKALTTPIRK